MNKIIYQVQVQEVNSPENNDNPIINSDVVGSQSAVLSEKEQGVFQFGWEQDTVS
jgi:hypothetical protein